MVVWLFYNTVIPLLPVPLVLLGSWLVGANRNILSLLRDGQLCFYCTALSAVAIRDVMLNSGQEGISIEIPLVGLLFCIIFSTFTYGIAVTHDQAKDWKLALTSIFTTIVTIIIVAGTRQTMGLLK